MYKGLCPDFAKPSRRWDLNLASLSHLTFGTLNHKDVVRMSPKLRLNQSAYNLPVVCQVLDQGCSIDFLKTSHLDLDADTRGYNASTLIYSPNYSTRFNDAFYLESGFYSDDIHYLANRMNMDRFILIVEALAKNYISKEVSGGMSYNNLDVTLMNNRVVSLTGEKDWFSMSVPKMLKSSIADKAISHRVFWIYLGLAALELSRLRFKNRKHITYYAPSPGSRFGTGL
jgi:hypothetical protein